METEYYTLVEFSTLFGIVRWIMAALLVMVVILFLVKPPKDKRKYIGFIGSLIASIILVPMLLLAPTTKTAKPTPVDPIPQTEPEPTPEPEPDDVEPVTPPKTDPKNNTTPSTPSEPDTPDTPDEPNAPDEPDTPDEPDEPEVSATYTVIHRQQNLNDDDYSAIESETGTGIAGKEVTPATKTYTGFIAPTAVTVTVAKDNSTEVVYDYNREIIDLTVDDSDLYTASLPNDGYKYGTEVTLTAKGRTGYVFSGWSNGATTNTVTVTLGADEIPEPTYEANTYRIVFNKNSNEATGSMAAQVLTYDQQEQINANSFTLPGYSFDHWNTKDDDSGESFTDRQYVKNLLTEGDFDLYAFWTPNTGTAYTVNHYKMDVGGLSHTLAETESKTGTTDTEVTPDHKEYIGFTADSPQTKKITGDGQMVVEYYYSRNQYELTFGENAASITSDDFVSGQKYYYEQTGTLTAGSKTGYTFESWTNGATDASLTFAMGAEDTTIGANYRANTYSVIFHANYPNSSATASQSFEYNQTPTALDANSFEREGYTFDHWNTKDDNSGNDYSGGANVQNLTDVDGGEYHLYAQWTPNTYNIVFDKNANGATGSMAPQGMTYDQAANLSANQFQRENFDFEGWSTNPNATTKEYSDGDSVINLATSGDITLYAVWEDKFPVVFSIEGDCIFNGKTGTITTTSACQFDGSDFVGQTFIDTGISLNTEENFDKDYEISFNIDNYSPNGQEPQTTFVSNKISTSHSGAFIIDPNTGQRKKGASSPGVVVRMSGENIDTRSALYNSDETGYDEVGYAKNYTEIQSIKLVRHNRVIYASVNGGNLFELQDVSSYHQYFNQTTWFGAYPDDGSDNPAPKRVLIGTLSNLSIRLGEMDWNYYEVKFDPKKGNLDASYKKMYVEKGSTIDPLPTTTRSKYVFTGWYIGSTKIEGSYTPSEDVEIKATWLRDVTNSVVTTTSLDLIRGEEANLSFSALGTAEPFTLSSSDESIATVDQNGKVTAIAKGQANIILTGSLSGATKEVPVTVNLPKNTVHFNSNGGNEIADITDVEEGSTITLPTQPTRTGFIFDGWFLENSDTEFTANTPIMNNTNVEARWTMNITNAIVSSISITRGESAQVNVTNANELEPFTYRSDDTNIVTVDESGNITTVSAGSTTITLIGSRSNLENPVNVTVAAQKYTVHFNSHGGSAVADIENVIENSTLDTLPTTTQTNYLFDGWFTAENGGTQLTTSTPITGEITYHAHWTKSVKLAEYTPASFTLTRGENATLSITNSSDIEPYTLSSNNDAIATIDQSGSISAVANGSTKLAITGNRSNETVEIDITVNLPKYTVHFNTHGGSAVADIADVTEGDTISVPASTLENHVLEGWFTAEDGGEMLTASTPIMGEITYHAQWKKDVTQAVFSADSFELEVGETDTFTVTNTNELETYSITIADSSIATLENDTITAVSVGNTTITITGDKSNLTKTASVTVTPSEFVVHFNAGDGTASQTSLLINAGGTISELPTAELSGYVFDGWWTEAEGGAQLTTETIINEEKTFYAHWLIIICKKATELHVSTCHSQSGKGCILEMGEGDEFTYGQLPGIGAPKVGDAYDCDVDGKNGYDKNSERFYYMYTDATSNKAVFAYSDNVINGVGDGSVTAIRYSPNSNSNSVIPTTALGHIPSTTSWKNVSVDPAERQVYNQNGGTTNSNTTLPTINYENKAARIMTVYDINTACGITAGTSTTALPGKCMFLVEKTSYETANNKGYWLTTALSSSTTKAYTLNGSAKVVGNKDGSNSTGQGVRPVIEVPLNQVEKYQSSDEIVQFNIQSEAAQTYFANVDIWNSDTNNKKDTFLKAMKANFDDTNRSGDESRRCIYNNSPDITSSRTIFPDTYRYEENGGTVYCDRPAAYDTGIGGNIKVYLSNENREKGAEVTYLKTDNGIIENMIPGTIYRWELETDSSVYGYVKATGERRFITLSSARNVRDIGGLTGTYGTLKYGRLMRGEKLGGDDVNDLRKLGITMEYDLRESVQSPRMGDDADVYKQRMTIHYDINPADTRGSGYYDITRSVLAEFMQDVIDGKNIYFHCSQGSDRTGTIAYLAEGLLGIDYETRTRDYELSSLSGRADRTRYYEKKSESDSSDPANGQYSGIKKYVYMTGFIETEQDIIDWFKAKLTTQEERDAADRLIEDFRAAMIDGYTPQYPNQ